MTRTLSALCLFVAVLALAGCGGCEASGNNSGQAGRCGLTRNF